MNRLYFPLTFVAAYAALTFCCTHAKAADGPAGSTAGAEQREAPAKTPLPDGPPDEVAKWNGHTEWVHAVAFFPDGRRVLSCGYDGTRVWDVLSGETIWSIPQGGLGALSADGKSLIVRSGDRLALYDPASGKKVRDFEEIDAGSLFSLALSPDGRFVVSGHSDGAARVWSVAEGKVLQTLQRHTAAIGAVAYSPDGKHIATGGADEAILVWESTTGQQVRAFHLVNHSVLALAFTPDGRYVASGGYHKDLFLWDFATERLERRLSGHDVGIRGIAASPDGHHLVSAGMDKTLRVWDLRLDDELHTFAGPTDQILAVAISPDGRFAASSSGCDLEGGDVVRGEDFAIRLWRLPQEQARPEKLAVAVFEFVDKGPSVELAPLRTALAEMITGDLSKYRRLRAVERVRVDQFLKETSLGNSGLVDPATAQRAGRVLAADYLLSGSFSGNVGTLTLEATLTKVGEQQPVARWTLSRPVAKLFELEHEVVQKCLAELGVQNAEPASPPAPKKGPSPPVAVVSFRNVSGSAKLAEMESGFAHVLQADLGAFENIRLVEREELLNALTEHKLSLAGLADPEVAAKVGRLIGAERFIYGSFVESGGRLRLMARLADSESSAVLASETVEGAIEGFAGMIEQLSERLAADLRVEAPPNAEILVRAATPVRKLEAAIYAARGRRQYREDKRVDAAESFQRALVIEPDNLGIRAWLVECLYLQNELQRVIEVAEESLALKLPLTEYRRKARERLYYYLGGAYRYSGQPLKRLDVLERWAAEFPNYSWERTLKSVRAQSLRQADRFQDAIDALEADVIQAKQSDDPVRHGDALAALFLFYDSELHLNGGGSRDSDVTKRCAMGAVAVVDDLLDVADGRRDDKAVYWGKVLLPHAADVAYVKDGVNTRYLDTDGRVAVLRKCLRVFSWNTELAARGYFALATNLEEAEQWQRSLEAYRKYLEYDDFAPESPPSSWDFQYLQPTDWIDKQVEARYRIAKILHNDLNRGPAAIEAYQDVVRKHGAVSFRGPDMIAGLTDLDAKPVYDEKTVLLWGGSSTALRSWETVLKPKGFTVHAARRNHVTAADLSPYRLVFLLRCGNKPLNPVDILGLRSYVATGGSLLVVISPAYEAAAPGIHNGLLAFFGARAGQEGIDPATSTRIADHPITQGISAVTARHAVALNVPDGASLIESDGKTVLAALSYRHGRIVISSFGQWFLPQPAIFGDNWKHRLEMRSGHWTSAQAVSKLPVEQFQGDVQRLVDNVIDWLAAPRPAEVSARRAEVADAWLASQQFESQAAEQADLIQRMDKAIEAAEPGVWLEEALWLAGDALLRKQYFGEGILRKQFNTGSQHLRTVDYGERYERLLAPQPKYFQRLIDEFPDSPLRPYAQWRLGDCKLLLVFQRNRFGDSPDPERALAQYEQVEAPAGSVVWAWKHLRIGMMHLVQEDFASALAHFREVSEQTEPGPEKSIALLNQARCFRELNRKQEAKQSYQAVMSLPNIIWWAKAFEEWHPHDAAISSNKYEATIGLQKLSEQ